MNDKTEEPQAASVEVDKSEKEETKANSESNLPNETDIKKVDENQSSREEGHKKGLICEDRENCPRCDYRVFSLTMKFFQDKFFELLSTQHGSSIICPKKKECRICRSDEPEKITCTICDKPTGANYKGILGVELVQIHPTNKCLTEVIGPIKRCGCVAHVRLHLLCSNECKKQSIFKDLSLGNVRKEGGLIIGETGPLMIVQQILDEEGESAKEEESAAKPVEQSEQKPAQTSTTATQFKCVVCEKPSTKICTGCRNARYCDRECQVAHWRKGHKQECGAK